MDQQQKAKLEAARQKTGYRICDIPKVSDKKLFDAIMERYKGKVVLVDYWATWVRTLPGRFEKHGSAKRNVERTGHRLRISDRRKFTIVHMATNDRRPSGRTLSFSQKTMGCSM